MIELAMYLALGFVSACLLALLIAPAVWHQAVRLTKRKIEATMPISVADVNADKDILRAEYAVKMRRLELALDQAKQSAARHLMERNRHMMEMGKLESELAGMRDQVAERTKAGSVMEQTVRKRLPELEDQLRQARRIVAAREQELVERARAYANQVESLELAQSMIRRQEKEIDQLRETLESGVGGLTLWGKGASNDKGLSALSTENGKLKAELSRLRERISQLEESDAADVAALREEMQHLADAMLGGTKPARRATGPTRKATAKPAAKAAAATDSANAANASETRKGDKSKGAPSSRKTLLGKLSGLKRKKVSEPA